MKGGANLTWSEKYKNDAMFHEVLMHFFLSKGTSNLIAKGRSGLVFGLAAPDDMEDRFFPLKDHLGNAVRKVILKLGCIHDTSKKWVLNADLSIMSETKTEFDEEFEKQVVVYDRSTKEYGVAICPAPIFHEVLSWDLFPGQHILSQLTRKTPPYKLSLLFMQYVESSSGTCGTLHSNIKLRPIGRRVLLLLAELDMYHGDCHESNFVLAGDGLMLIDFSHSGDFNQKFGGALKYFNAKKLKEVYSELVLFLLGFQGEGKKYSHSMHYSKPIDWFYKYYREKCETKFITLVFRGRGNKDPVTYSQKVSVPEVESDACFETKLKEHMENMKLYQWVKNDSKENDFSVDENVPIADREEVIALLQNAPKINAPPENPQDFAKYDLEKPEYEGFEKVAEKEGFYDAEGGRRPRRSRNRRSKKRKSRKRF